MCILAAFACVAAGVSAQTEQANAPQHLAHLTSSIPKSKVGNAIHCLGHCFTASIYF